MDLIDSLDFVLRLTISGADRAAMLWAITAFLIVFVGLGLVWGRILNHSWGISNHLAQAAISCVLSVLAAIGVLNWQAARQAERWLETQRETVIRSVADSGLYNRSVLRSTWDKLQPLGGQANLASPRESGNILRLNSLEEALVLAETAADEAKSALSKKSPFEWGVTPSWKAPSVIAEETVNALPRSNFPVEVTPSNDWTRSAAAAQAGHAFESLRSQIKQPMSRLQSASVSLILVAVVLQAILVAIAALGDIKVDPRV